jgi:hypothetical protein
MTLMIRDRALRFNHAKPVYIPWKIAEGIRP